MLQDYSHYATIISGITSIILLTVSSIVAIFVYKWNRENGRIETTRKLSEDLRHYNELVLHNEDLQELVSKSHRWGNLEKEGVIKMYRYFILFNIAFSMYEAKKRKNSF